MSGLILSIDRDDFPYSIKFYLKE